MSSKQIYKDCCKFLNKQARIGFRSVEKRLRNSEWKNGLAMVHLASAGLDKNAGIGSVRVVADPALCPALTARIRATGGGGVPGHRATTRHALLKTYRYIL